MILPTATYQAITKTINSYKSKNPRHNIREVNLQCVKRMIFHQCYRCDLWEGQLALLSIWISCLRAFPGAAEDPLPQCMEATDKRELILARNSSQQLIIWWGGTGFKMFQSLNWGGINLRHGLHHSPEFLGGFKL